MANDVLRKLRDELVCPIHRVPFHYDEAFVDIDGSPWPDGRISCSEGCEWPIRGGIPRFVPDENYASSFGLQWNRFPRTELDSSTGKTYSRERLERCLGAPLEALGNKTVLECGAGAGRFTELLIRKCAGLVSIDLSTAVDANLKNCGHLGSYVLLQADICASPLPFHHFDVVICLGVIQHTPDPELTLHNLRKYVKPGGCLVIDHYTQVRGSTLKNVLRYVDLAHPLRAVLIHLKPQHALRVTTLLTALCDPVRRRTSRIRALDRIVSRLLPTACYYNKYPDLDPRMLYEWHQLDTFDMLTDRYKHLRSPQQIRNCLESLGLRVVACELGGNGVEARAIAPD